MSTVEEFYNRQWSSSSERREAILFLAMMKRAIRYSYRLLGKVNGKKMLEIGCGSGEQAAYFAHQGAQVTAIDISDMSLRHTRELALLEKVSVQTMYMDAQNMTFHNNSFDFIYINSTLMHLNHDVVFEECKRVLKKGGKLVIVEPLDQNLILRLFRRFSVYRQMNPRYMNLPAFKKYASWFSLFTHREFYFISVMVLPIFTLFPFPGLGLWRISSVMDRALLRAFPELGPWCWVSVVEYQK